MATPSMFQALMGAQTPQMPPQRPMTPPGMPTPPFPPQAQAGPLGVQQATRTALLGLLGEPSEGQSQTEAVTPSPTPASTLERWGFDPMSAQGRGAGQGGAR